MRLLARWFLDASFQVASFQVIVTSHADVVTFWCPKLSFERPGASIFGPWGTLRGMGAAEQIPWGPESDDGKHSLEWSGLRWESVSL